MRRYTAKLRTSELPALATAGPAADAPLPAAAPDTGFDRIPLPSEVPPGVSVPRPRGE